MSRGVAAAYLACALIWGTTWFAIRVSIGEGGFPTFVSLALRFAIAMAILIPIALRARPWPRGRAWGYLVLAGVLDAVAYALVYLGEERVPGAVGAVLYGTQPLILAVLLTAFRIERITPRHIIGSIVSLVGVGVLFHDRLEISSRQAAGVAMIVGSVVASTAYSMLVKQHGKRVHGVVSTAVFLTVTAIVLAIAAAIAGKPIPWPPPRNASLAVVYLAVIGTVIAFYLYFWMLQHATLVLASTLVFVFPLIAIVTDALFEAERLGAGGYLGAAIVLGGLGVSLRRPRSIALDRRVGDPRTDR
ncbi:MAG: DMT family transporter [Kofleriaceae bacterium]